MFHLVPPPTHARAELLPGLSWEQGLATLLEVLPVGCLVTQVPSGIITLLNQEGEYLLGSTLMHQPDVLKWGELGSLITLDGEPYPPSHLPVLKAMNSHEEVSTDNLVVRHPDGREVVLWWRAIPLETEEGRIVGIMSVFQDITRVKEVERHLHRQSHYDELTQLPNRRGFESQAARELERALHSHAPLAALMLDLDHFKHLNDQYGHLYGDAALKTLAGTLRQSVRPTDLICRWGGEEFAVLAPGTSLRDGLQLGDRIRQAVSACPVQSFGIRHRCTISIGVATITEEIHTLDELLHAADTQLYQAKAAGRNRVMPEAP